VTEAWRDRVWELPPLILHPFHHDADLEKLVESSRFSLYVSGLLELQGDRESLEASLLAGRYVEFRMVCCVGKDVLRWMKQCADFARREESLAGSGICEQSFSDLVVHRAPAPVAERFHSWGVMQYERLLVRAIGLNAVFPHPPEHSVLSPGFLADYYSYAESLFACYQERVTFTRIDSGSFRFSLYTSQEYSQILETGFQKE